MLRAAIFDVRDLERDELFRSGFGQLSEYRCRKVMGYHFRKDRNLSLGCGLALDFMLGSYQLNEKEMIYQEGINGKPTFVNHPEIHFNLSHAGHFVACTIGTVKMGIDIEPIVPFDIELAEFCCNNEEINYLNSIPTELRDQAFTQLWTRKESFVKAKGSGFEDSPQLITLNTKEYSFYDFHFDDYNGCICTHGYIDRPDIEYYSTFPLIQAR